MGQDHIVKSEYDEERRETERLADFTDALLGGEEFGGQEALDPALTQTVRILGRTLRGEPAPSRLRYRVLQAIRARWPAEREGWWQALRRFLAGSRHRRVLVAASVLVVMAFAVSLMLSYVDLEVAGTAAGEPGILVWALGTGVVIAVVIAVVWWRSSSR